MTLPHFHIPESLGTFLKDEELRLVLSTDIIAHMITLRLRPNERFTLVDPTGQTHTFELLEKPARKITSLPVRFCHSHHFKRPAFVRLVQGISKGERMDQTIRQVTELGIAAIIPLESARSTVRLKEADRLKKQERWQRIACAAADQSACTFVPEVYKPCNLAEALSLVSGDLLLVAWEEFSGQGIREAIADTDSSSGVSLFIGPEGGFEKAEVDEMIAAGAIPLTLGHTVLRTETAAVIASALVLHELGELGNRPAP